MENNVFDFNAFTAAIQNKADMLSYEQNIDLALSVCTMEFRNYNDYCKANDVGAEKFKLCYDAYTTLLLNRFSLSELDCDEYIQKCNDFLEELQSEDGDYFDECVNITCEIMHTFDYIRTKDRRNITAILKLCFESAEFYLQRNGCPDYEVRISEVAKAICGLDVSSLTKVHESIRQAEV